MFTVCSKCNLRLTVTATDLRAAQGYVRCGRCQNVFNALASLADDPGRPPEQAGLADTQGRPALTLPAPPPAPAPVPAPAKPANDTSLEFNPASTNINEVFIEASRAERTGTFEAIVLAEDTPAPEPPAPVPQAAPLPPPPEPLPPEPLELATDSPSSEEAAFMAAWANTASSAERFTVNEAAATEIAKALDAADPIAIRAEPDVPALDVDLLGPEPAAPASRWPGYVATGALVLCLVGQLVHHYRNPLADSSMLHRPITGLYAALGMPLATSWDIANYEIRQLGASTDGAAAGEILVRASISNRATRTQPLPLLRVIMQDRFGNRVAGRDLNPLEYLGAAVAQSGALTPGQRVDAQVAFRDPGQTAIGFELDVCMAGADHTVTCANDSGNH